MGEVARQSLEGGATVVQLRDKLNDKGDILKSARELKALCDEYDALFVMNDHADLARASDAHVLHVGQSDLPVTDARDILAPRQLIGNSNNGLPEALASTQQPVDYLAVGAIYATTTMGKSGRSALGPGGDNPRQGSGLPADSGNRGHQQGQHRGRGEGGRQFRMRRERGHIRGRPGGGDARTCPTLRRRIKLTDGILSCQPNISPLKNSSEQYSPQEPPRPS